MELDDVFNLIESTEPEPEAGSAAFNDKYDKYAADLYTEMCSWSEPKREAMLNDAHQRFSTVLPLRMVKNVTVALVGAGGLGNWIWRVLLGMGFTNLYLFDDDTVGPENIGPQAHNLIDVGYPKVEAVRRAALAFRGVNIRTFNQRVKTFGEIAQCMGCTPDVVIGATDSTAFRNSMIQDILYCHADDTQLFIDLRMSLGDWNAYITTPKLFSTDRAMFAQLLTEYSAGACFTEEEAVHEPCTARAITYTGANVASYVGAFLHWWLTEGTSKDKWWMITNFYKDVRLNGSTFNWKYTYSSRDFYAETQTAAEKERIARLNTTDPMLAAYYSHLYIMWGIRMQDADTYMQKAYRGLDCDGHEVMLLSDTDGINWTVLDLTENKVSTEVKRPFLPVFFQYRTPGWEELSQLYHPSREYTNICTLLRDRDDQWYIFTAVDGRVIVFLFTVDEENNIVFGKRVDTHALLNTEIAFCSFTAKYAPEQQLCTERDDEGNYVYFKLPRVLPGLDAPMPPEPEAQPEAQPEIQHDKVKLGDCNLGDTVVFNGIEYEVAGYEDARCVMVRLNGLAVGISNLIVPAEAEVEVEVYC